MLELIGFLMMLMFALPVALFLVTLIAGGIVIIPVLLLGILNAILNFGKK